MTYSENDPFLNIVSSLQEEPVQEGRVIYSPDPEDENSLRAAQGYKCDDYSQYNNHFNTDHILFTCNGLLSEKFKMPLTWVYKYHVASVDNPANRTHETELPN